jgi:hypothetical protein
MAKATPDTARALAALVDDLRGLGRELRLSDLFRSYKMSGERVDQIPNQRVGAIQAALIRLGFDPRAIGPGPRCWRQELPRAPTRSRP